MVDLEVEAVLRSRLREPRTRKQDQFVASNIGEPERYEVSEYDSTANRHPLEGPRLTDPAGPEQEVYQALVLGTRDYMCKTGFKKALIALSGGIDSSLVATIAVDALGAEKVVFVAMPCP